LLAIVDRLRSFKAFPVKQIVYFLIDGLRLEEGSGYGEAGRCLCCLWFRFRDHISKKNAKGDASIVSRKEAVEHLEQRCAYVDSLLCWIAGCWLIGWLVCSYFDTTTKPDGQSLSHLEGFLKFMSETESGNQESLRDFVTLTTIHQAKGLEWPIVFVIRFNDGVMPLHSEAAERGRAPEAKKSDSDGEDDFGELLSICVTRSPLL